MIRSHVSEAGSVRVESKCVRGLCTIYIRINGEEKPPICNLEPNEAQETVEEMLDYYTEQLHRTHQAELASANVIS